MELVGEQQVQIGYKQILKQKSYMLYTIANLISRFGDSIDSIAYSWMVYELTGSAALMATLFGVNAIPNIIFQPIAGVYVDYKSKKKIQVICNIGRGSIVALTAFMFLTGTLRVYHLFIFTFINSTFEAFQIPSAVALMPLILEKEYYAYAEAFRSTAGRTVEFIGLGVAGVLIAWLGISGVLFLDALSFVICGIMMGILKHKKEELTKQSIQIKKYISDLTDGFKYIYEHKIVLHIALFGAMINVVISPYSALNVAYVSDVLKLGPEAISVMGMSMTIGLMLGGVVFPKLKEKIKGINLFVGAGALLGIWYLTLISVSVLDYPAMIYIGISLACGLAGICLSIISMQVQIVFMERVEQQYLGRAAGMMNSMLMCAMPLGAFIIGGASLVMSIQTTYLISGLLIGVLFVGQKFNKHLKEI